MRSSRAHTRTRGGWRGLARYSHYGKYTSSLYGYCAECVQTYGQKGLVDAELGYAPLQGVKLALGARNLFDVYPDRMREEIEASGRGKVGYLVARPVFERVVSRGSSR